MFKTIFVTSVTKASKINCCHLKRIVITFSVIIHNYLKLCSLTMQKTFTRNSESLNFCGLGFIYDFALGFIHVE